MSKAYIFICLGVAATATGCTLVVDAVVDGDAGGGSPPDSALLDADPDRDGGRADSGTEHDGSVVLDAGDSHPCNAGCVEVPRVISRDTRWDASQPLVLREQVYVLGATTLTIAAGALILGDGGALVVSPRARLVVEGTQALPVVFTSFYAVGGERAPRPGDWGGIVLLGDAEAHASRVQIPGLDYGSARLPSSDPATYTYGGNDPGSDCGSLRYLRIEFAGQLESVSTAMAGLTLAGCGTPTSADFVQVHRSGHVGLELLGGAPDLQHVVMTGSRSDGLLWAEGFRGRIQFVLVVQSGGAAAGGRGIRGENSAESPTSLPVSNPTLFNATLIGPDPSVASGELEGIYLTGGTDGRVGNVLAAGFRQACLELDEPTLSRYGARTPVLGSILDSCGGDGTTLLGPTTSSSPMAGRLATENRLGSGSGLALPIDRMSPSFVPAAGSPADTLGHVPPDDEFFAGTATHVGAFAPGSGSSWLNGWSQLNDL